MPPVIAYILGLLSAIAAVVLAFIFLIPEKKRAGLNRFFQWIHDVVNFKSLLIEVILKALYIFSTVFCVVTGFFLLFSYQNFGFGYGMYMGLTGVLLLILGPIITRLMFEGIMLAVLQLKNTIEINDKLVAQPGSIAEQKAEEAKKRAEEAQKRAEEAARQQQLQQQYAQQQQFAQQYAQQYGQQQYAQPQYTQPQYTQPAPQQPVQPVQPQQPVQPEPQQPENPQL